MSLYSAIRRSSFGCLVVATLIGCSNGSDNNPPATPWPGGVWEPPPASYGMSVERDMPVTMDDGVILHAVVGYPTKLGSDERAAGTFPVLLTQNPYAGEIEPDSYFVSRGYIHVITEVRGTQESQLSLESPDGPLPTDNRGRREALDGANLVAWAAGIDGSNGRVGLNGCSWLGINQLHTAGELDKLSPVKAMIPACAGQNYSTFLTGGVATAVVNFFDLSGAILGTKHIPENIVEGTLLKNDILAGGDRAFDREYWQERTSYNRSEKIVENDIPTLLWTSWGALEAVTGGVDLYSDMQNAASGRPTHGPMEAGAATPSGKYQIIVGDAGHGVTVDPALELLWYDHWLKGQETNVDQTNTGMHMFELGTDRWVNVPSWPITDEYTPFYLSDDGLDSIAQTHSAQLIFGNPSEPGSTISYDSQPLEADRTIAGPIGATLYIRSSNANAHIVLTLFDVAPDGSVTEVSSGSLLASMRDLDPTRSWNDANGLSIKPEGKFVENTPLTANDLYRVDIELFPTLRRVLEGHKLRFDVATQASDEICHPADILASLGRPSPCLFNAQQLPTLNGGVYEVVSDSDHPSSLNVPLVDPASLQTAKSGTTETSPDKTQPLGW